MAKTRTRRVQVQSSDQAIITGVHAPSLETTSSKAAANASVLSKALGLAGGELIQHQTEAGILAAEQGAVDEETLRQQEKSASWVRGAESVLARSRAIQDEAAMQEWYAAEFDKNKSLPELRSELNEWMATRYDGADIGIAKQSAPFLARGAEAIMAAHGQQQTAEAQALVGEGLTNIMGEFVSRPAAERPADEWDALRKQYTALFGRDEGLTRLAADVALGAVTQRNEAILADPMFNHLNTAPSTRGIMAKGAADAASARIDAREAEETEIRVQTLHGLQRMADAKDPAVIGLVYAAVEPDQDGVSLISESQANSILNRFDNEVTSSAVTAPMVRSWASGLFGTQGEPKYEDEASRIAIEQVSEEAGPVAAREFAVNRSVANGSIPGWIKQQINNAHPSNEATWGEAVEWAAAFEAYDPEFFNTQINDEAAKRLQTYNTLRESYDHGGALEAMKSYDHSLNDRVSPQERDSALSDVVDAMTDAPWSLNNVMERPSIKRDALDRFESFIALGYGVDEAAEIAVEFVNSRYSFVGGELWPVTAGWGVDGSAAMASEKVMYANELGLSDGDIEVVPTRNRPAYATIRARNSLPGMSQTVRIADIVAGYESRSAGDREAGLEAENAALEAQYRQRALNRHIPVTTLDADSESNFLVRQNEWWDGLTGNERRAILEEEAHRDKLAEDERLDALRTRQQNLPARFLAR